MSKTACENCINGMCVRKCAPTIIPGAETNSATQFLQEHGAPKPIKFWRITDDYCIAEVRENTKEFNTEILFSSLHEVNAALSVKLDNQIAILKQSKAAINAKLKYLKALRKSQ